MGICVNMNDHYEGSVPLTVRRLLDIPQTRLTSIGYRVCHKPLFLNREPRSRVEACPKLVCGRPGWEHLPATGCH